MTASRTCRACSADLRGDVMWCLRCYEPVRQLSPREAQLPTVHFLDRDEPERSRWKAGANSFGPVGRLVVTAIVLAMAPWSTNIVALAVAWPAYVGIAGIVLHATWKKDLVDTTTISEIAAGGGTEPPPEPVRGPGPRSTWVAWGALAALAAGLGVAWFSSGDVGHAVMMICGSLSALVLAVRWLARA